MKKHFWIVALCLICAFLIFANIFDGVYIGMTYDDFMERYPPSDSIDIGCSEKSCFTILNYAFYTDKLGNPVIATFDKDHRISRIDSFKKRKIDLSAETFNKISEGMTIYEVAAMVGVPYTTATSGMFTLVFHAQDEGRYVICFTTQHPVQVLSVKYEPPVNSA